MYPPIKTRLVGTLAGWGPAGTREVAGAPGEAVAGRTTSKEPCYLDAVTPGWMGELGAQLGLAKPTHTPSSYPTTFSIALKNQEPFAS